MALQLFMIGLLTHDMGKSLEFYRRLGLAIPEGSEGQSHVEVKMDSGLTFFLDSRPSYWDPGYAGKPELGRASDNYPFILEFYLKDRATLEAKYHELTQFGYHGHRAPYETSFGMHFALVNDPDGNTILLSANATGENVQ